MLVYKITNNINGKVYIGITEQSLAQRWNQHLLKAKQGDARHLYNAMRKYGIDNFSIEIVEDGITDYNVLLEKEKFYVSEFNSLNNGYNMTSGGDVNPMDETIVKVKHDTKMRSPEVRAKISSTMKRKAKDGTLFTEEHRKNLSKSAKGNHNFGSGDTRSIGCYCILEDGSKYEFHSYKEAGLWWFETLHPFGDNYAECTFQRKIKASIAGKPIKYIESNASTKKHPEGLTIIEVSNIKWYALEKGGDINEKVN